MESGDGAAGHRDEQRRKQVSGRCLEAGEGRHGTDADMGAEDADDRDNHHKVQKEAGQVVPGLQQNPDRNHGGDSDVDADHDHPGVVGQIQRMEVQAQKDNDDNSDDTDDRGCKERRISAVDTEAEEDGQDDEQERNHCRRGIGSACCHIQCAGFRVGCLEGSCNHGGERSDHKKEGQVCEDQEHLLHSAAHRVGDDLADGLSPVADRCEQSTKVMDAAEEDTADQDPEHNRNPAEDGCLYWSGDGACTGDGGEVVAHQDSRLGGDIVDTVVLLLCRSLARGIHAPDSGKPTAVEDVATGQNDNAYQ